MEEILELGQLRTKHLLKNLDETLYVRATVYKVSAPRPVYRIVPFQCRDCHGISFGIQDIDSTTLTKPDTCSNPKCDSRCSFTPVYDEPGTELIDVQDIILIDNRDTGIKNCPRTMKALLVGDTVGSVIEGGCYHFEGSLYLTGSKTKPEFLLHVIEMA
jgi:DNA replicative helicase MCM subunit Mcm2 (Cdc46/Mcm family)